MSGSIEIERHTNVALVRLNRPEARNAMNLDLATATVDAIEACQDAGAIVLTGTDPAFCAGLDLRQLGTDRIGDLPSFTTAVAQSAKPVIGAVNGPAVTGGFELALACDFLIGSERASFADTHLRVGVYPGPVLVDLPRRVGLAWARELSLTGNFIDAETALRIGLLNHVVGHDRLVVAALELAAAVAEQDPEMVRAMRAEWRRLDGLDEAHRAHTDLARDQGFRDGLGTDLTSRRAEVLRRAHEQREAGPSGHRTI